MEAALPQTETLNTVSVIFFLHLYHGNFKNFEANDCNSEIFWSSITKYSLKASEAQFKTT